MVEKGRVVRAIAQCTDSQIVLPAYLVALFGVPAFEPWVSVVTTLVGVLTTYAALTAADFLTNSYGGTARQLAELATAWREGQFGTGPEAFQRFVHQVEQVISREHSGWTVVVRHASQRD